jgi:S-adenosylmethionine/arginine decarboxylase-like enzyme
MVENQAPDTPPAPIMQQPLPPEKRKRGRPRKQPIPIPWTAPAGPPPAPMHPAPAPQEYGQELILDIHEADPANFTRARITEYMHCLCDNIIYMEREDLHFWDYEDDPELKAAQPPHLKGVSAVQFIKTSNITIHTLDDLRKVFINIFSCKQFSTIDAKEFTCRFFAGTINNVHTLIRK